ncbi:ImmA/IrrE family metallo-endopeptidase [Winogradskyella sp.]|uniref:ImmA/IrrE family metallo-endopeptidase n=1 Tax=Winogradskyella sp. TaxID=1883156 RepID=UPI003BAAFAC6
MRAKDRELTLGLIKKAREFKKDKLGLSYDEPINIKEALHKLNVLAVFRPMSKSFSGMALKVDNRKFMLINSENSIGRQNFTVCHELYHLFIQENFSSMICDVGSFNKRKNPTEFKADFFAAQLLMPRFGIIDLIPPDELREDQITELTLLRIESHFKCSRKALLHTLKLMNFITEKSFDKFLLNIVHGAQKYGFDTYLYKKSDAQRVIGDYNQHAWAAYGNRKISYTKLANYMLEIGIDIEDSIDENVASL